MSERETEPHWIAEIWETLAPLVEGRGKLSIELGIGSFAGSESVEIGIRVNTDGTVNECRRHAHPGVQLDAVTAARRIAEEIIERRARAKP